MTNQENIKVVGDFSLKIIDAVSGNILEEFQENNKVVSLGFTNISKLLGGDAAGKKITKIAVGTNSATPALGDTTLTSMASKAITGVEYPEANSVRFLWSLEAGDANGITIREFGLLNENNVLCARKVRADIVKTSAVRLVGSWKISIN